MEEKRLTVQEDPSPRMSPNSKSSALRRPLAELLRDLDFEFARERPEGESRG